MMPEQITQLPLKTLSILARRMRGTSKDNAHGVEVGLTYLGQFIAHDIVFGRLTDRNERDFNFALNLDSLYGKVADTHLAKFPERSYYLNKQHLFNVPDNARDIWRDERDMPLIAESRNTDNAIILQFHRLWQDVHNRLIEGAYVKNALEARKLTVMMFQSVTIEHFLASILNQSVWEALFNKHIRHLDFERKLPELFFKGEGPVPDFFAFAAFRFGHSMVREEYKINVKKVKTKHLFIRNRLLATEHYIDWSKLFIVNGSDIQRAKGIDTMISNIMTKIPARKEKFDIAFKNLQGGRKANLKPGLEYFDALANYLNSQAGVNDTGLTLTRLEESDLGRRLSRFNSELAAAVRDNIISLQQPISLDINNLDLWPYLLLEAERQEKGNKLGVLGSIMVGECVLRSIQNAKWSVVEDGNYDPSKFNSELPPTLRKKLMPVSTKLTMANVINFVEQ